MRSVTRGVLLLLGSVLVYAGCSDESRPDRGNEQKGSVSREHVTLPALDDWDGRHYDIGEIRNPRRVVGGWVVQWDRFGLPTSEEPENPDAFSDDTVEPYGYIMNLTDYPVTNVNPMLRELSITKNAWLFLKDPELSVCPGEEFDKEVRPPWQEANLAQWIESLQRQAVLLTFDKKGRVVQIRAIVGC